ncbi:FHA domain-containing CAMK family serine/threonine-protein kinase [Skeletonema marinoi]|uniref:FHA domain-containing CAMK family serine/threonine-protein kinase n=1 Tax=Skeletonema marinoi TaxID=267567 RepID=A0AAD9D7E8_9STRA|nr:FHA domain-containing CAMK family serine/threonine-protein kinase [Skeletonema marinoi]
MDGASESTRTAVVAGSDTAGDGIVIGDRDNKEEELMTSDNPTEEQPPDDNNNNNVGFEEEEPETQESFTQHEMTQTGNELTQMGLFDDDDDGNDCNDDDDDDDANSRQPMIDPLTLPWGRLMPVGSNGVALPDNTVAVSTAASVAAATSSLRPSTREAIEMLPRPPETRTITRSRSPSMDNGRLSSSLSNNNHDNSNCQSEEELTFLGLNNLLPSDRFNEYVLGRSAKADITAQKLDIPATTNTNQTEQQKQQEEKKRKSHDYIHAMISNRHCRMYCLLNLPNKPNNSIIQNNNANNTNGNNTQHPPEMEVFVEDTSGNGTLINGTTLLRKNERRKLHTGDVICLLNPKLLYKKIRNGNERKRYMQQYSFVFVNLYEQERHWNYNYSSSQSLCGVGGGGGGGVGSPLSFVSSSGRKGQNNSNSNSNGKSAAVNPRATRCHSTSVGSRDDLTRRKVNGQSSSNAAAGAAAAATTAKGGTAAITRKPSLGSFLNNQSSSSRRRRVEDEYDLRDLLGTGTCGEVRRAIHRRTGDERAVKIISITERGMAGANFFSKEKLSAIQAEAEILRSLDHPYVVKLFDVFVAPGKAIYLVMELIRGGDLFDRIVERERYTEVHARRLFRRILSAVHYLHEQRGVVHRDLKPENILVVDRRSDVDIKLTDFGLAKNLEDGLKTFCGTPQYFAPEVLRRRNTVMGNGRYGKEIDCWSIGVILFILLSGSPPFDVSAGFDAVASAKVIFYEDQWKDISSEARNLVRRLLEKDAKKRMSVKDACEHPWILVDDGDTHCHPLQDPVVTANTSVAVKPTEPKPPLESNEKKEAISDTQAMPAPPPQLKESPKVAAKESPKPASKKRTRETFTFLSKSAPQLSKIEHNKNSNSKKARNSSLLPLCDEGSATKKIFQQAVDVPEQQLPSSPISAKLLFAKPSNEGSVRKISKQNVESIKTAGNTLPKPSLSAGSRLLPKKKIQQQLGVNFKKADASKPKALKETLKPAAQSSSDKENGTSEKEKLSSSTVTPPGVEHTLVFRLNKKRKTGKHIAADDQDDTAGNAITAPAPKAELSEDELMSDFSDDEGGVKLSKSPAKKRKIDEFLYKRPSESIQSTTSIQSLDSKGTKSSTNRVSMSPNLEKQAPEPLKCKTNDEVKQGASSAKGDKTAVQPSKSKKKKQTFLFGKPPPDGLESLIDVESSPVVDDVDTGAAGVEVDPPAEEGGKESVELERQSSSGSLTGQATSSTKGKQKSIKNWFQPKK